MGLARKGKERERACRQGGSYPAVRAGKELVKDSIFLDGWEGCGASIPPGSLPGCPLEFCVGTPGEVEGPRVSRSLLLFCRTRPCCEVWTLVSAQL